MKVILTSLIAIFFAISGFSQIVQSSCEAPDSIRALYTRDAAHITFDYIYNQKLEDTSLVELPQAYLDTFMNALLAVYNAPILQADTVVNVNNIHHNPLYWLTLISIGADSSASWMQQLKNDNIPTGNSTMDSLMDLYDLSINNYYAWPPSFGFHSVVFESLEYLNMLTLSKEFEGVFGVQFAHPEGSAGDGHKIFASIQNNYILINYLGGWGDCPSGCTYHYGWQFKVYHDCKVEFIKNIYTDVEELGISNPDAISFGPNPFQEYLQVNAMGLAPNFDYEIYDVLGRLSVHGKADSQRIVGLGNLPSGTYFLRIPNRRVIQLVKY